MKSVGKSIPHDAATGHATGSAPYIEDLPELANELWVTFVGSPVAAGKLKGIDTTAALALEGVEAIYTAADIPGANLFGAIIADEPFLATEELAYLYQPVAVVAARDKATALKAQKLVTVAVEAETPILDVRTAIDRGKYLGPEKQFKRGDLEGAFAEAPHSVSGEIEIGGQEQFYLESMAAIAYPAEDSQMVVHASTQNPTELQHVVAHMLGRPMNDVVCICKRMGGGFGGKETQTAIPAMMAALVAQKTGRAARVIYTKDDDMMLTGKRHPYLAKYAAAFGDDGVLTGVRLDYFSDGGAYVDLSVGVLERTMFHADNAYFLPTLEINARICKTNLPPNTAFRGFGGPQGVVAIEAVMEEIAQKLGIDAAEVRQRNLYGEGERNITPYEQVVENNVLPEVYQSARDSSEYQARRGEVDEFNKTSKTHLKGLALTGVKFGISFTTRFLNQGNALVNVYYDGSVQVSTGATEMGQGTNTKILQIVAEEFGIDAEDIRMMATSTEKNINTSPTAASASTDLNGYAAQNAARAIKGRMAEFAGKIFEVPSKDIVFEGGQVFPRAALQRAMKFSDFCVQCRLNRVDLGARGFYSTPGLTWDKETGKGKAFHYFTNGAAVTEVTIDRFTGEMVVDRADLLMDLGRMINPAIDRGQVIGGFIQGMGWVTAEKLTYSDEGKLLSHSPTTYKIPGFGDVPKVFNLEFFENDSTTHNIYRSKAVGEPPLLLGISVWAAVKNAIFYHNKAGASALNLPATGEEILRCIEFEGPLAEEAPAEPAQLAATVP